MLVAFAHLLARQARHAGGHQRDEQERHGRTLDHLRPEDVPVGGVEVEVREAEHGPASTRRPMAMVCAERSGW